MITGCLAFVTIIICGILIPCSNGAFTLITFDVDGTLVRGSGQAADNSAHSNAFGYACGKVLGGTITGGKPTKHVSVALPRQQFHGSTDGLILLRLARATLGVESSVAYERLDEMMDVMFEYISALDNEQVANGISPLPGVLDTLRELSSMKDRVACGLVTGNVEGIARRKMDAVGIYETDALAPPVKEQLVVSSSEKSKYPGTDHISFLGGFGSDFCSGNIDDMERNHLDRAEQIAIATRRCREALKQKGVPPDVLRRVVHVGDAPADVLAAKSYSEVAEKDICVGMVAVATGSYSAEELRELAGKPIPGQWEPVVLENGMADPSFLSACGL